MLAEPFTDNISNYRAGISFELIKIEYSNNNPKLFSESEESVRDYFFKSKDFGEFLKTNPKFIAHNFDTSRSGDFLQDIYSATNRIRERMAWNGKKGKYANGKAMDILGNGSGNSAGINQLLVGLLRQMGYRAEPVLPSTVTMGGYSLPHPLSQSSTMC